MTILDWKYLKQDKSDQDSSEKAKFKNDHAEEDNVKQDKTEK